mgnify:CR=1 FL=1
MCRWCSKLTPGAFPRKTATFNLTDPSDSAPFFHVDVERSVVTELDRLFCVRLNQYLPANRPSRNQSWSPLTLPINAAVTTQGKLRNPLWARSPPSTRTVSPSRKHPRPMAQYPQVTMNCSIDFRSMVYELNRNHAKGWRRAWLHELDGRTRVTSRSRSS